MAVDNLVNIVWVCPVLPGASSDANIWDKYGPQRTKGCLMEFEVGIHDGARKGRLHSHVPFIGCKTLTVRQHTSNDIHGHYRARVEHLSARHWSWWVVRDILVGVLWGVWLFLPYARMLPQRRVYFRVVTGKVNYYLVLHVRCGETPSAQRAIIPGPSARGGGGGLGPWVG